MLVVAAINWLVWLTVSALPDPETLRETVQKRFVSYTASVG
jgi:hypothetical protein